MQSINKRNTTYMGMAFLFLSLAITPISLKAVNISPNLFAGADAWRQISSMFGDSYQPVTSSELLALNNLDSGESAGRDNEVLPSLVAQLQFGAAEASAPRLSEAELQTGAACNQQKRCNKSAQRTSRVAARVAMAAVVNPEIEIQTRLIEAAAKPEVIINKEALRDFEKHLALRKFDIGEAMKIMPESNVKLMVKLRGLNIAFPVFPKCDSRKSQPPEQVKEARLRASRARVENASPTEPENCEL